MFHKTHVRSYRKRKRKRKMKLFKENGQEAGLYDICEWWIETYPSDVFIKEPKPIVEARMCMRNILIRKEKVKQK